MINKRWQCNADWPLIVCHLTEAYNTIQMSFPTDLCGHIILAVHEVNHV